MTVSVGMSTVHSTGRGFAERVRVLAAARRYEDAARLQAAVLHHAELLGVRLETVVQAGSGAIEIELTEARHVAAEKRRRAVGWVEMMDLAGLDE